MCVVSNMVMHLYVVGIPLLLMGVLAAVIWRPKGTRPVTYTLGEKWAHPPILWAATDERVGHGGHGDAGHGAAVASVGGGASGTW